MIRHAADDERGAVESRRDAAEVAMEFVNPPIRVIEPQRGSVMQPRSGRAAASPGLHDASPLGLAYFDDLRICSGRSQTAMSKTAWMISNAGSRTGKMNQYGGVNSSYIDQAVGQPRFHT